jgi:Arc/MetJ family transcription regulator
MTRTLINVDDELLAAGQQLLGTATKKDTVNAGLRELLRRQAAAEILGQATDGARQRYLLDVSAVRRLTHRTAADRVAPLIVAGLVATCGMVELQLVTTAADHATLTRLPAQREPVYTWLPTVDADLRRALVVHADLLAEGAYAPWPALVVAAVAEREEVTVLHHDEAFDLITKVTAQPVERLP